MGKHYRWRSCLKIILISQQETSPVIAISAFYCLEIFYFSEDNNCQLLEGRGGGGGGGGGDAVDNL